MFSFKHSDYYIPERVFDSRNNKQAEGIDHGQTERSTTQHDSSTTQQVGAEQLGKQHLETERIGTVWNDMFMVCCMILVKHCEISCIFIESAQERKKIIPFRQKDISFIRF